MRVFCAICAVVIPPIPQWPNPSPTEDLKWYQEIRAVRLEGSNGVVAVTGIGYFDSMRGTVVPLDPTHTYRTVEASLELISSSKSHMFHAACWEILCDRFSENYSTTNLLPEVWFNVLRCTPRNKYSDLSPGHDFGGAARFRASRIDPLELMANAEPLYSAKPAKTFPVNDAVSFPEDRITTPETLRAVIPQSEAAATIDASDVFSRFPVEVLYVLLTYLPSQSIQELRLASRSIACMSRSSLQLPQAFWRSRFAPDFEMGFAPLGNANYRSQNWRTLYFAVKRALRDQNYRPGLQNRRRIWELVSKNVSLFDQQLSGIRLHGIQIPLRIQGPCDSDFQEIPGKVVTTKFILSDWVDPTTEHEPNFTRTLLARPSCGCIYAVGVSTVLFNSQVFVSGVRILFGSSDTSEGVNHSLGYVTRTWETLLRISDSDAFDGFELAACVSGITGLRIMLKSGSHSSWVGDIGQGEPEIAFGILPIEDQLRSSNIVCHFDAFKMTAMAVTNLDGVECVYAGDQVLQPLWTPCHPGEVSLIPTLPKISRYERRPGFNPILNINFGGTQGQLLSKLTRIVVHLETGLDLFVGMAFDYNGEISLFGRQGRTEVSFLIDGPNGERISQVTSEEVDANAGIRTLYFRTNFGNSIVLANNDLYLGPLGQKWASTPFKPFSRYYKGVKHTRMVMEAEKGQVISGFTAVLSDYSVKKRYFRTFGLQTVAGKMPNASPSYAIDCKTPSIARLCNLTGSQIIRKGNSGCQSHTSASLEGVRCIRVSRGSTKRPRESNEISGLLFEYSAGPSRIAGQWLVEADHMELSSDEKITGISILASKLQFPNSDKTIYGRVISISISTTMQSKTIQLQQPQHDTIRYNFQANRLERLASIVWAFNSIGDHPRVLPPQFPDSILDFWFSVNYLNIPQWIVPEKVLWEEKWSDRIATITAYRSSIGEVQCIRSLIFTYESGTTRSIGTFPDDPVNLNSETLSFVSGDRIVGFDSTVGGGKTLDVTFHLERVEKGEPVRRSYTFRCLAGRNRVGGSSQLNVDNDEERDPLPLADYKHTVDLNTWECRDYIIEDGNLQLNYEEPLPEGELVGLWGFSWRPGDGVVLGPLFLHV